MARENRDEKARRLLVEGRVRVDWINLSRQYRTAIRATVTGDTGEEYLVTFDIDKYDWSCPCEARGLCSHIIALQLVCRLPGPGRGGTLP